MAELLLTRHAKSYANVRDIAFGNTESPLTDEGRIQAAELNAVFKDEYGIVPEAYDRTVLASELTRPQQTAELAGFRRIDVDPIINESDFPRVLLVGREIIRKHTEDNWLPEEIVDQAQRFLKLVRAGKLEYQIFFTHGLFVASVLSELTIEHEARGEASPYIRDLKRGFIPRLAVITPVNV